MVLRLASILLFLKKLLDKISDKGITKYHRISQAINPDHIRELAWTQFLKASSKYFPPQIPHLAEIEYLNGVQVLISRLENVNLSLHISLLPIISPKSLLLNTLIRSVHHHKLLRPLMGCKTILSCTTCLKTGHFAVHTNKLKHYLTEYSKTCGICNAVRCNSYKQHLHSNLTNIGNPF